MAREHKMGGLGKKIEEGYNGLKIEDDPRTVLIFRRLLAYRYPGYSWDGAFFNFQTNLSIPLVKSQILEISLGAISPRLTPGKSSDPGFEKPRVLQARSSVYKSSKNVDSGGETRDIRKKSWAKRMIEQGKKEHDGTENK